MDPPQPPPETPPDESAQPLEEVQADDSTSTRRTGRWLSFGVLTGLMLAVLFFRPLSIFVEQSVVSYHSNQAIEAFAAGDSTRAVMEIDLAMQWLPDAPQLLYMRAQVHAASENWSASLVDYDRLVGELAPHFARGYLGRSRVHREMGNYDQAEADLQRVMELTPASDRGTTGEAAHERARLHRAQGQHEAAAAAEAEATELGYSPRSRVR